MPLGAPVDDFRELATAFTLICGGALVMVRLRVEQRAVEQANQRVRLLATACEQAGELIVIVGAGRPHRIRERRVLPRVRLLARGARRRCRRPAGRARVARRRSRRIVERLRAREQVAHLGRARAQGRQHVSTPPAPPRRLSTTPAGSRISSASSATSPRSCGCASSWCAASGCRRSASSSPASRTRSTTRCSR